MEDPLTSSWRLGVLAVVPASMLALNCRFEPTRTARPVPPAATLLAPTPIENDGGDAGAPAPSLESLALLSSELAPGMRELARGESPLPATIRLSPTESNTCVRAVLGAGGPVVGALLSDTGRVLDMSEAAKTAVLGARGPVCLKKDQAARIDVQGPEGLVRYVVWVAP